MQFYGLLPVCASLSVSVGVQYVACQCGALLSTVTNAAAAQGLVSACSEFTASVVLYRMSHFARHAREYMKQYTG